MTNDAQTIKWSRQCYPFGESYNEQVSTSNYIRFPGQWEDNNTDLYYNWHRFYRPELGQYITPDPIGLAGGINMYSYVGGNPINYIDPYGLYSLGEFGHDVAHFWIGVGDGATFGLTKWIRSTKAYGGDCYTNEYSKVYISGDVTGQAAQTIIGFGTSGLGSARNAFSNSWVRNNLFRWGEIGRFGKLHLHIGPTKALMKHHLPYEIVNWSKNFYNQILKNVKFW